MRRAAGGKDVRECRVGKGALAPRPPFSFVEKMVGSRSLSSGARSRDPLAQPTLRTIYANRTPPISDFPNFSLTADPNQFTDSHRPVPQRGGSRSSRTRGGMRWTQAVRDGRNVLQRTAKSCGSDAPMLVSSLR